MKHDLVLVVNFEEGQNRCCPESFQKVGNKFKIPSIWACGEQGWIYLCVAILNQSRVIHVARYDRSWVALFLASSK